MRKVVLQTMTTLNGRLDDPDAWVRGISRDLPFMKMVWLAYITARKGGLGIL